MTFSPEIQSLLLWFLAVTITMIGLLCLVRINDHKKQLLLSPKEYWTMAFGGITSWLVQMFALLAFYVEQQVGSVTITLLMATVLGGMFGFETIGKWLKTDRINGRAFSVLTLGGQVGLPTMYVAILGVALMFK